MAIKTENIGAVVSSRKALVSLLGTDTAPTFKATADVTDGFIPALSPVVIAEDGSAAVYTDAASSVTVGDTDQVGFTASDRSSDDEGNLNVAVLRQAHVRYSLLSEVAQAVIAAAPASALQHIIVEGDRPASGGGEEPPAGE